MNIKSLLLGSAAAFAVVSGAQAADAIVAAQPEPMEYVKVCDAFGTGYFYIPGTETCLKIGGTIWYEARGYGHHVKESISGASFNEWGFDNHVRTRVEVSAKNDSEYGTVYSWIRLQSDEVNGWVRQGATGVASANVKASAFSSSYSPNGNSISAKGYMGIGGLEAGYFENQWLRFFGYGGFTYNGGLYGYSGDNQYISYTADFGPATVFASLDNNAYAGAYTYNKANVVPNFAAGAKYTAGNISAGLGLGYDEALKSIAAKGYVEASFDPITVKAMLLYSQDAGNFYGNGARGWTGLVGLKANLTDKLTAAVDVSYGSAAPAASYFVGAPLAVTGYNAERTFAIAGDLAWNVTNGFNVLAEATYQTSSWKNPTTGSKVTDDVASGFLRLQRSF